VYLGEGYSRSENRQRSRVIVSSNSQGPVTDAVGSYLPTAGRLLAILLAVVMLFAVVYVFRRSSVRASKPSMQPTPLLILPFAKDNNDQKFGHQSEICRVENIALLVRRISE
jgi:hypothetical protein